MKGKVYKVPMLGLRMVRERTFTIPHVKLDTPLCAAEVAHRMIGGLPTERLIAIVIDGAGTVTGIVTLGQGGQHGCGVLAADVLRAVLACHGSAFVLAHNHPSGDPNPSREDVELTEHVRVAAKVVGLTLLDHVIVTRTEAFACVPTKGQD